MVRQAGAEEYAPASRGKRRNPGYWLAVIFVRREMLPDLDLLSRSVKERRIELHRNWD
jgi:hypothetical protein